MALQLGPRLVLYAAFLCLGRPQNSSGLEPGVDKRRLSECHYDFRLGKTVCIHHDGSLWVSGKPIGKSVKDSKEGSTETSAKEISIHGIERRRPVSRKSPVESAAPAVPAETPAKLVRATPPPSSSPWVTSCFDPGCAQWKDSSGRRIEVRPIRDIQKVRRYSSIHTQAHGGGMLRLDNGTYFWYGESEKLQGRGYGYSAGVNCYSSQVSRLGKNTRVHLALIGLDSMLVLILIQSLGGPWRHEGLVLSQSSIWVKELTDKDRPFVIERYFRFTTMQAAVNLQA